MKQEKILDFPVCAEPGEDCLDHCLNWLHGHGPPRYFVCANPHSLEVARRDPIFHKAIQKADLVVPDGAGIVLASKILGGTIRERVTGSDLFHGLSRRLCRRGGGRCFFLGSTPSTLKLIRKRMAEAYPEIDVVGMYSPPFTPRFRPEETREMVERVNHARPDILWVGMTAPKQEKWIFENREKLAVPLAAPIGAVFDFFAGNVKRSQTSFQKLGMEWLPRLLKQPRRLWKRNFVSNPAFLARVLHRRLRLPRQYPPA
jgi:N-acetylglucosaminyldiphosphoundecaprenol N-acetyl-beta-D-mannosaminyltransferase